MWPKRRVLLIADQGTPEVEGVRALLKGLNLEAADLDSIRGELSPKAAPDWVERPFNDAFEEDPFTEGIVWADKTDWPAADLNLDIPLQSPELFLHNNFANDFVLGISESAVLTEGCPLLGHILKEAGFEPSILWQTKEGIWNCECKQGLIWLLPAAWLRSAGKSPAIGQAVKPIFEIRREIRNTKIDFYRCSAESERDIYLGHLPRWPKPEEEFEALADIAQALELGVSWFDLKSALKLIWTETINTEDIITDNLRWNSHGIGWNAGSGGKELSFEAADNLENWRAG